MQTMDTSNHVTSHPKKKKRSLISPPLHDDEETPPLTLRSPKKLAKSHDTNQGSPNTYPTTGEKETHLPHYLSNYLWEGSIIIVDILGR